MVRPIAKPREHAPPTDDEAFDHLIDNPVSNAPRGEPLSSRVIPGLTAPSPPQAITDGATPPMAPGVGGFNIDPPVPRAEPKFADPGSSSVRLDGIAIAKTLDGPGGYWRLAQARTGSAGGSMLSQSGLSPVLGDVAIKDMRRSLLDPKLVPGPPIRAERKAAIVSTSNSSLVFNLLGVTAIVALMLLAFADEAMKPEGGTSRLMPSPSLHQASDSGGSQAGRLVVEDQKGFTNEPLPLGISLKDASAGETVTVLGLAEGTELSLGTSKGPAGWLLLARDLDQAFVGARADFVGVMDATVNLHSTSGQLLDSQSIRFEWIERR